MKRYTYNGDRLTDPELKGKECTAVLRTDGKCIRGRNSNMLVEFNGKKVVVLARQLRKKNFPINKSTIMQVQLLTLIPKSKKAALVFRALNHKLRQQFLEFLLEKPESSVTSIYVHFRLEQSVASQHLAILRSSGLVSTHKAGKQVLYSVNENRLLAIGAISDQLNNN